MLNFLPDKRCEAIKKLKRFRPPPKLTEPASPAGAIKGSDDKYFKYEIMQELPGGRISMGSNEPNSKFGEFTAKTLGEQFLFSFLR